MTISDGVKNKHYEDVEHLHRHPLFIYHLYICVKIIAKTTFPKMTQGPCEGFEQGDLGPCCAWLSSYSGLVTYNFSSITAVMI